MDLPYYGNSLYFDTIENRVNTYFNITPRGNDLCTVNERLFLVPVKFWIFRLSGNDPNVPTEFDLHRAIDNLNTIYQSNSVPFKFVMLCPETRIVSSVTNISNLTLISNSSSASTSNPSAINVYIYENFSGAFNGIFIGLGSTPPIGIRRDRLTQATLAHEIGHYFSLQHTFRNGSSTSRCRQEAVSRTRRFSASELFCFPPKTGLICEKSGDFICDTEAENGSSTCSFIGGSSRDNWGDLFLTIPNNRKNIMSISASNETCRVFFSRGQKNAMLGNYLDRRTPLFLANNVSIKPDNFEPDNSPFINPANNQSTARLINLGETQCHSFHTVFSCPDPVDWLRFASNSFSTTYRITLENDAANSANTVRIWNIDALGNRTTQRAATVQNISSSIRTFTFTNVPNATYLIEVVRNGTATGVYKISINNAAVLSGADKICTSSNYSVSTTEPVVWSASPTNIVSLSPSGSSVTVNKIANGNVTLTANVGCCLNLTKTIQVGDVYPNFSITELQKPCPNGSQTGIYVANVNSGPNITYSWSCSSCSFVAPYGANNDHVEVGIDYGVTYPVQFTLTAVANGTCGSSNPYSQTMTTSGGSTCDNGGAMMMAISPNPANSQLQLKITDPSLVAQRAAVSYQITISDAYGNIKYATQSPNQNHDISLARLSPGVYSIRVIKGRNILNKTFTIMR